MLGRAVGFFRVLLWIILFVLTAATVLFGVITTTLFNRAFYGYALTSEGYIAEIKAQCEADFTVTARVASFPSDYIGLLTDTRTLKELSRSYADNLYSSVMNGGETERVEYPLEKLVGVIESADSDGILNDTIYPDAAARGTLAGKFKLSVDYRLNSFNQSRAIAKGYEIINQKLPIGRSAREIFTPVSFGILSVFTTAVFVLTLCGRRENILKRLYMTGGVCFCGGALALIPLVMLKLYGIEGRIPIAVSPLKSFLTAVINAFIKRSLMLAAAFTAFGLLALIIGAAAIAFKQENKSDKQNEDTKNENAV